MAALHEKYLWPLTGVVIFAVLAAFYIDDRRRLAKENTRTMTSQDTNTSSTASYNKASSTNKSELMLASSHEATKTNSDSKNKSTGGGEHQGFTGSIDDYIAQISSKRNDELIAAVKDHQGFSGSVENYLSEATSTQVASSEQQSSNDSSNTTFMRKDEDKTEDNAGNITAQTGNAYSGSIEDYTDKFGNGEQTPMSANESDPFQTNKYTGFHGSYEEYAKKYN